MSAELHRLNRRLARTDRTLERPFGHTDPGQLFAWAGGARGLDDYLTRDFSTNIGAEIMGRNKFGRPDPDGLRQGFIAERRGERELLLTGGLTAAEVDRASELLDVSPDPPRTGFVLCHGDVSPEHVFVDEALQVSALIDWGEWHGGSSVGELALVATTFGWDDLAHVLQGYGHDSSSGDILHRQLATTAVGQLTGHIAHHVRLNDPEGASQNVAAIRGALRILG